METTLDDGDIRKNLGHYREDILLALYRHGELRTSEVRNEVGMPRGSKEHHLGLLQDDWGLIKEAGRTEGNKPIPERIWTLTETGQQFVSDHLLGEDEPPSDYATRVERLENTVERLESELKAEREARHAVAQQYEDLHEEVEETNDRIDRLVDRLNTDYWQNIIDEIEKRT